MSLISGLEQKVNSALGSALNMPSTPQQNRAFEIAHSQLRSTAQPTPAQPIPVQVAAPTQPGRGINTGSPSDDAASRAAAAAGSGSSGLPIPPVGVRGLAASGRVSILGR